HRQHLLHQRPESEFLQHGGYGQQPSVRSQVLAREIIGRGSADFIGLGSCCCVSAPCFSATPASPRPCLAGLSTLYLFLLLTILVIATRVGWLSRELRHLPVLLHVPGVIQIVHCASAVTPDAPRCIVHVPPRARQTIGKNI